MMMMMMMMMMMVLIIFHNSAVTNDIDYPHHHQHLPLFGVCCVNVVKEVISLPSSLCLPRPFTP